MTCSGFVQVGMENITGNFHCKQICMKKVVVSHGTTVWT